MGRLISDQDLQTHTLKAYNFASESQNKIHSDETAALYGFKGGLVPGVGVYGYLTIPVVEALGRDWLERGRMKGKFIKPVYDGETVEVRATVSSADPLDIAIEVVNGEGVVCAVGEAGWRGDIAAPRPEDFPYKVMPPEDDRLPPKSDALPKGLVLGSLDFTFDRALMESEMLDDFCEPLSIYRGPEGLCHPALVAVKGNTIVKSNIALGPWIHTESETIHYGIPTDGENLSLRGQVSESFVKRGHEFVVADLALFGRDDRALARIIHTAIVCPRQSI